MVKKKMEKTSKKLERQIEILSHYYNVDKENKVIDLELKTEKASDFLVSDISTLDRPLFKTEIIGRASEIMDSFPSGYKVNLSLKIDDYEGVEPDVLLSSLKDSLEMVHYSIYREKNKNWLLAATLIVISALILFIRITLVNSNNLDGAGLLNEMIDITGWAFLWEGVTILFLSPSNLKEIAMKVGKRLLHISLKDKDGNVIRTISRADYVKDWINESRRESIGKALMVISGAACIVTGIMNAANTSITLYRVVSGIVEPIDTLFIVVAYVEAILFIVGGAGIISMYQERGKLRVVVPYFAYTFLVFDTIIMIIVILISVLEQKFDAPLIVNAIKSLLVTILYFVSYLIIRSFRKKELKNLNK